MTDEFTKFRTTKIVKRAAKGIAEATLYGDEQAQSVIDNVQAFNQAMEDSKESLLDFFTQLEDEFEPEVVPEEPIEIDTVGTDDNVGDISVEINVDEIVAKIEADESDESHEKHEARRKLEDLEEQRKVEEDLGDTYNINLDAEE